MIKLNKDRGVTIDLLHKKDNSDDMVSTQKSGNTKNLGYSQVDTQAPTPVSMWFPDLNGGSTAKAGTAKQLCGLDGGRNVTQLLVAQMCGDARVEPTSLEKLYGMLEKNMDEAVQLLTEVSYAKDMTKELARGLLEGMLQTHRECVALQKEFA